MEVDRKENTKRFKALDQQNASSNKQQSGALEHIRQRIEDTQQQINTGNAILNQISNTLRLDWLRQLGSELKGLMRRAVAINIATYHAVISIQAALPSRLERVLIEEPFILEDPIGRIAPVHLQFVTSWEAFHAIMEHRFSNLQGFRKIQQRKYGLQDRATRREIEQTRPWQRAFLPGQRVEMAFIFQSGEQDDANATDTTCPGCQTPSNDTSDTDVHCQNCLIWFRRFTVVQEVEPTPQMPLPQPWKTQPKFGQSDLRIDLSGPVPPGRRRVAPDDLEGEEDVREFKRVRLMRTKKLVKQRQFGVRGSTTYTTFIKLSKDSSNNAAESSPAQVPLWRPGEATSQYWGSERAQPTAPPQLPELPECFRNPPIQRPIVFPHLSPDSGLDPVGISDPLSVPNPTDQTQVRGVSDESIELVDIIYKDGNPVNIYDPESYRPDPQDLRDKIKTLKDTLTRAGPTYPYRAYYQRMIREQYEELEQLERDQTTATSVEHETSRPGGPDRESAVERRANCNEAERRPAPDEDQGPLDPPENTVGNMPNTTVEASIVEIPLSPPCPLSRNLRYAKLLCDLEYLMAKDAFGEPLPWSRTIQILLIKKLREEAQKINRHRLDYLGFHSGRSTEMLEVQQEQNTRAGPVKPDRDGETPNEECVFEKKLGGAAVIVARAENADGGMKRRRLKLSPLSDLEL